MKKSSILIIYTGGTIGMKTDAETGALVPFDFSGIYDEFPSLKRLNVDIEVLTMSPVLYRFGREFLIGELAKTGRLHRQPDSHRRVADGRA